ncbi:Symbiotic regulator homolog 1 [Kingella potus]|uniref:Symbiotic regulator homolog 1 n=1 Tax=Kingella potus TaxID=265175 RepID=A0A377R5C1_9NEIS|nr:LysR family transcriptional regulator [Kingella potus]UOO99924.1 LysR family transcriptional regulator [Kingella potus]STR03182.1 Symbiotic regulator homolog 1 [Kingella potus]
MKLPANLDLNLLKALYVLLEERNVTRAAGRLALSQSAVSGMLARLRLYFGDEILVRTPQGMVPTERAAAFAAPLARIFGEIDALVRPADFDPAAQDTVFRIGVADDGFYSVGIPFLRRLQTLAPNVKTAFFNLHRGQIEEKLAHGALDAAVVAPVAAPERLRYKVLYRERFVCAMRIGHPVLRETWDADTFCRPSYVLGSFFGGVFTGAADETIARMGLRRNVAVSVQSFAQIPAILRQSDLLAVVPSRLVRGEEGLEVREVPFAMDGYDELLVWHERSHADPAHRWLRERLAEAAEEGGDAQKAV